ncbi:hypothetical protein CC86DRAFT_53619 [Ophiobolus disseminans]|uniref:Uncharacterized protein n=1 Tax=Ophiobolus disseminans TaxID=1469910 RepID=A0A6A6ZVC1_9PLEO|nr:hypothetical protein CC86DRAFT_53619 [Ophiobolus disseminans]
MLCWWFHVRHGISASNGGLRSNSQRFIFPYTTINCFRSYFNQVGAAAAVKCPEVMLGSWRTWEARARDLRCGASTTRTATPPGHIVRQGECSIFARHNMDCTSALSSEVLWGVRWSACSSEARLPQEMSVGSEGRRDNGRVPVQHSQLTHRTKSRSARHDGGSSLPHRTCAANFSHCALFVDPAIA